ncbi:MAG: hypothetical protein OXT09_33145 [Myxococcales bacterium]|nr:hypothetical protein [Myxococcales bacterium]
MPNASSILIVFLLSVLVGCATASTQSEGAGSPEPAAASAADDDEPVCADWQQLSPQERTQLLGAMLSQAMEEMRPELETKLDPHQMGVLDRCVIGGLPGFVQSVDQRCEGGSFNFSDGVGELGGALAVECAQKAVAARDLCKDWRAWEASQREEFVATVWGESIEGTASVLAEGGMGAEDVAVVRSCLVERQPQLHGWMDGQCAGDGARISASELGRRAAQAHVPGCLEKVSRD